MDKALLISLKKAIPQLGLPFIEDFQVKEYRHPASEEACFLIILRNNDLTAQDNLLLLLERLEYLEEEWTWSEGKVKESRNQVLGKALHYIINNGHCQKVSGETVLDKLAKLDVKIELDKVVSVDSSHYLLFDDWNVMQLFGFNQEQCYLITWYTTA